MGIIYFLHYIVFYIDTKKESTMNKIIPIILIFLPLSIFSLEPYHEVSIGYSQDLGLYMGLRLEDSSKDFPIFLQGRGGYVYQVEPGNATEAREIFINDNAGGNIEEYGESYMLALDLGYKLKDWEKFSLEVTLSGLWNYYLAHFAFIGNNESFAVNTSSFGVGAGAALRIPISKSQSALMLKTGLEYYPKALLEAHGTYFYTPDGEDDRVRNDYTYEDADKAINQPEYRFYLQVGLLYRIGAK